MKGLLGNVPEAQAISAKGDDENWSVLEVVCHFRDAEEISFQRTLAMRDFENPQIIGYDQEALAREKKYNKADLKIAMESFISFREGHLAMLSALSVDEWERGGEHNENGHITIFSYILHKVSHDAIHCAQIARQLAATTGG